MPRIARRRGFIATLCGCGGAVRGEADHCLLRALAFTPLSKRNRAKQHVIAGGPRRIAPATHAEWSVRRSALAELISWRFD